MRPHPPRPHRPGARRAATALLAALLAALLLASPATTAAQGTTAERPELLLRLDDVGMTHAVNLAIAKVAATGMPFSVSVMVACPWYQEAVDLLRKNPQISVGVHLVLNAEWKGYRWGPVLGAQAVPSLVDSVGYFLPSSRAFLASKYDLGEVERDGTLFDTPVAEKRRDLLARAERFQPGTLNLLVAHTAEYTPEIAVLVDMNNAAQNSDGGEPQMARHREAELAALLSPEFERLRKSGRVTLTTYREVIAKRGRSAMQRPRAE